MYVLETGVKGFVIPTFCFCGVQKRLLKCYNKNVRTLRKSADALCKDINNQKANQIFFEKLLTHFYNN